MCQPFERRASIREAIALNAFEERRHKDVLAHMIRFYGIDIGAEPDYPEPRRSEWTFVRAGYGEFIDSFFAFGLRPAVQQARLTLDAIAANSDPVGARVRHGRLCDGRT